ncbi:MAG: hypothetical protein Q4B42_08190 [Oscillospiraceae bacterium]|nr:hypothetical protein [Oscillospiraceae bacterium]
MDKLQALERSLPATLCRGIDMTGADRGQISELRLRAGRPYAIMIGTRPWFFSENSLISIPNGRCLCPSLEELTLTLARLSEYSLHKHPAALSKGYLTVKGGHRIGVCAARNEEGAADASAISSLSIRVAGEVEGCAAKLMERTQSEGPASVLLAGPPLSGKTTLLRDFARLLSDSPLLHKVVVADERGELAALYGGKNPMKLGTCCDVVDALGKGEALDCALRALSPEFIVFDELGGEEDLKTLALAAGRGIRVIASVHAQRQGERLPRLLRRIASFDVFDYIVFLKDRELGVIESLERMEKL